MAIIVIAEDEFLLADMLSSLLEDAGHEVRAAAHGAGALKLVRTHKPDLIITDFMMPGMTGLELAESIRARKMHTSTPIMLMSGAQAYMGAERPDLFDEVIEKPFDIDQVIDKIHALFQARL